jgi:hypothetical protein
MPIEMPVAPSTAPRNAAMEKKDIVDTAGTKMLIVGVLLMCSLTFYYLLMSSLDTSVADGRFTTLAAALQAAFWIVCN